MDSNFQYIPDRIIYYNPSPGWEKHFDSVLLLYHFEYHIYLFFNVRMNKDGWSAGQQTSILSRELFSIGIL